MAKKDFSAINTERYGDKISTASAKGGNQGTASEEEMELRRKEGRTRGRKQAEGRLPDPRINVKFDPHLYDYVRVVSKASGMTMNDFIVAIIRRYVADNPDSYRKAKELIESLSTLQESLEAGFSEDMVNNPAP